MNRAEKILLMVEAKKGSVTSAIKRAKVKLVKEWEKTGGVENFGEKEVRKLRSKFDDSSDYSPDMKEVRTLIDSFENWCMDYTGK